MLPRFYGTESDVRKRQINTLKIFNERVTEIKENSEYLLPFTSGRNELNLQVVLKPDFPNEKPVLIVSPVVIHPWVDGDGEVVGAPGLLNFTVHSDLGRVVQAVIREFERTPPPLATDQAGSRITSPSIPIGELDGMGRGSPSYAYNYPGNQNFSPPNHAQPVLSVAFPELNKMADSDLKFLNENIDVQQQFVDNLPPLREMNSAIDEAIAQIEQLTGMNLLKCEYMDGLRKKIESKIETVTKLAFENEQLNVTYQALSEQYSPKNIQEHLRQVADSTNRECEKFAEAFLDGEIDVDTFLNSYIPIRAQSQSQRTREEKLHQQLQDLEKAGF